MLWFCFILDRIVQDQNTIAGNISFISYFVWGEDTTAFYPQIRSFSLLPYAPPTSISSWLCFHLNFPHLPPLPHPTPFHFLWSLLGHVLSVWWGFYLGIIFILPKAYKPYWSLSFVKRSESEAKITCNTMMYNLSGISVLFFTVTEHSPPQFFLIKHLFVRNFLFQRFHFLWWGLVLWVAWEKRHIFIL